MLWPFKLIDLHKLLGFFGLMLWYSPMNQEDLRWELPASSESTKNPDGYGTGWEAASLSLLLKGKTMEVFDLLHMYQGTPAVPILNFFGRNWCESMNMQCVEQLNPYLPEWENRMTPRWFPWLISLLCASKIPLTRDTFSRHLVPPYLSSL